MSLETWTKVDEYIEKKLALSDAALEHSLSHSAASDLPPYQVSATQGKFLQILAESIKARSILEIGTLGGYSTIWMARALPADGRLISLELDKRRAEVARENIAHAKLSDRVEILVGAALDTLPKLGADKRVFDLIFIDADKPHIVDYFDWAISLSHPGTVIIVDNMIRDGAVAESRAGDNNVMGAQKLFNILDKEKRVSSTAIQTVGPKGYDGFVMAVVK